MRLECSSKILPCTLHKPLNAFHSVLHQVEMGKKWNFLDSLCTEKWI